MGYFVRRSRNSSPFLVLAPLLLPSFVRQSEPAAWTQILGSQIYATIVQFRAVQRRGFSSCPNVEATPTVVFRPIYSAAGYLARVSTGASAFGLTSAQRVSIQLSDLMKPLPSTSYLANK